MVTTCNDSIRIGDKIYTRDWLEKDAERLQHILAKAYRDQVAIACLCQGEAGIPFYIQHRRSGYVLCKYPDTGAAHHPLCPGFEVDERLSGRSDYHRAIQEGGDGCDSK